MRNGSPGVCEVSAVLLYDRASRRDGEQQNSRKKCQSLCEVAAASRAAAGVPAAAWRTGRRGCRSARGSYFTHRLSGRAGAGALQEQFPLADVARQGGGALELRTGLGEAAEF